MNRPPIRLGPLAVLLLVITIALSTLAILTFTTARADRVLSERFADAVRIRYELDREGHAFLADIAKDAANIQKYSPDEKDGGYLCRFEKEGYTLSVTVSEDGTLMDWDLQKDWDHSEDIDNLWPGK